MESTSWRYPESLRSSQSAQGSANGASRRVVDFCRVPRYADRAKIDHARQSLTLGCLRRVSSCSDELWNRLTTVSFTERDRPCVYLQRPQGWRLGAAQPRRVFARCAGQLQRRRELRARRPAWPRAAICPSRARCWRFCSVFSARRCSLVSCTARWMRPRGLSALSRPASAASALAVAVRVRAWFRVRVRAGVSGPGQG